jgi:hypothetical protein
MLDNIKIKVPTFTTVTFSNAGQLVLAANPRRTYAIIQNVSTVDMWMMFGSQGAVNQGVMIPANGYSYEIDRNNLWQGAIYCIHSSGINQSVNVLDCQ